MIQLSPSQKTLLKNTTEYLTFEEEDELKEKEM
jgi:hypothetical protein